MTHNVNLDIHPDVQPFFDPATNTISYVVKDPASDACAIVDSVMDIDYAAGRISHDHADQLIDHVLGICETMMDSDDRRARRQKANANVLAREQEDMERRKLEDHELVLDIARGFLEPH